MINNPTPAQTWRVDIRAHRALGFGVFARELIPAGDVILAFGGPIITKDSLPTPYVEDRFTQVGRDLFMGPSGEADDYVNHSCEPNAGLHPGTLFLVALRDISLDEEIAWDYSTYIIDDEWEIQ